ncbi:MULTISPECIES: N-acetyltransferase [unclassified Streptomyces]|uniref:GNAT family N-acetyltransferase n=1 Tax=unclassified Streptomyces TaxID=2593676 RepID=UPI0029A09299|nr:MULTISPECIES: N-acetyltransferase [unclassified Streptomyces]MDX3772344.1 N-acetyltransferase [Streptomyces sp. AK08-01B]MDX3821842.1 N-acetyltransferase [Streptomyces sp. AK08-01A]
MSTTVPVREAEQTEIKAYVDFVTGAPVPVRQAMGVASLNVGSVQATTVREDPSDFFNRAGGFGLSEPIDANVLAKICDFYRSEGVSQGRFVIAPQLLPADWETIVGDLNLTPGGRLVKLGCATEAVHSATDGISALDPSLHVAKIEPHHAYEWATVMMAAFGMSGTGMIDVAASCVGRPAWQQYGVWEGERIVAVGSLFVNGDCANMFGGGTLPDSRGRGAQSALLTIRARAALAEGCRWLVAETGAEGPGEHNTSLHNMRRAGFEPMYDRVTWLWRK